jgi:hypothetical protein
MTKQRWTWTVDQLEPDEPDGMLDIAVSHGAFLDTGADHSVTVFLFDDPPSHRLGPHLIEQITRLVAWLNHIAPDGVIRELPPGGDDA